MRILLAASASYDPPKGGSTRSNLVWLRAMAKRGHECLVLSGGDQDGERVVEGVRIRTIANFTRQAHKIGEAVAELDPDYVLVSSEDLSHNLLRGAHAAARHRLVYIAHTPQWFPFGPEAWHQDEEATRLLADALAIVSIGQHMAGYIERHLGRKAHVVPPAMYGQPPWPEYDNFARQSVLLINPSTVKGLPIFLALAKRFPERQFLALKGWGTTVADERAMRELPNIEVLDTVRSIDEVFARTSVLVAPSLWYEGFGLVVTEALLRGVPVLASNHGGLTEAAASSRYRLPVSPISHWESTHDDTGMPVARVETQPVVAWEEALDELLGNERLYAAERRKGMEAARAFASSLTPDDLETLLTSLTPRPLRIQLIHNSTYFPGAGGGDKSNRLLMAALAADGHQVRVFTRLEQFGPEPESAYRAELQRRGRTPVDWGTAGVRFEHEGTDVRVVTHEANLRALLKEEFREFSPDIILCSTDDPAHLFYETALAETSARVVFLVRATIALPFGPDASTLSEERTRRLREADAVVCVSEYVARYCREHGGLDAVHVPISLGDAPNPPHVGRHGNPFVTLVNPSAVKGLPVLLGLADAMPGLEFAAVPSWGTTQADYDSMAQRPNIRLLEPADDISDILKQTRVTLVPSLWAEARSRMVVESLSRGVPVLAADVGGLREAMCGVDYVLPVQPIVRYHSKLSDQMVPEAEVPPQDVTPWIAALSKLVDSEAAWQTLSDQGREAALAYLANLSAQPLEKILRRVIATPRERSGQAATALSPTKRKLLALRLEKWISARRKRFFPITWGEGPKVILCPWAAAGAQSWSFLREQTGWQWLPVLLPGREDRRSEPTPKSFDDFVPALATELEQLLTPGESFWIAGHSMGGGIAFELTRELRRRGAALPHGLLLSSCTAPASRRARTQAQTSHELIDLDRAMFGAHVYAAEPPLPVPIIAMRGAAETLEQIAWGLETSAGFTQLEAPGGHFWLKDQPQAFVDALLRLNGVA